MRRVLSVVIVTGLGLALLAVSPARAQGDATVYLTNAWGDAPDQPNIFVVCVDDEDPPLDTAMFTGEVIELARPAGPIELDMYDPIGFTDCATATFPILSETFALDAGDNVTITAGPGPTGDGVLSLFDNDVSCVEPGVTRLSVDNQAIVAGPEGAIYVEAGATFSTGDIEAVSGFTQDGPAGAEDLAFHRSSDDTLLLAELDVPLPALSHTVLVFAGGVFSEQYWTYSFAIALDECAPPPTTSTTATPAAAPVAPVAPVAAATEATPTFTG